jgi:hypothetical protein
MIVLLGVFFAGIVFALVFVYPVVRLAEVFSGPHPSRIQTTHRRLFGSGLWHACCFLFTWEVGENRSPVGKDERNSEQTAKTRPKRCTFAPHSNGRRLTPY